MKTLMPHFLALVLLVLAPAAWAASVVAVPVPETLQNHWPADWENEFQARSKGGLARMCAKEKASGLGNRTYFENEKRAYGFLMAHLLAGDERTAIEELQKEDAQAKQWHSHTAGIDVGRGKVMDRKRSARPCAPSIRESG
jgi:hypothetical protein